MPTLSILETNKNSEIVQDMLAKVNVAPGVNLLPLHDAIVKFTNEKLVTLENLREAEPDKLQTILEKYSTQDVTVPANNDALNKELAEWSKHLLIAVYGSGSQLAAYTSEASGMASDLLTKGSVSATQWGTDLDILLTLNGDFTSFNKDFTKSINVKDNRFILTPVSLTESIVAIQEKFNEAINFVRAAKRTNEIFSLIIPVNCGNNHWRLVGASLQNGLLDYAGLWDSLAGDEETVKARPFYKNLEKAAVALNPKVKLRSHFADIQKNGYSCMDFVVQQICKTKQIHSDIAQAGHPEDLRLAIVKHIAINHPSLGQAVADNLVIDAGQIRNTNVAAVNQQAATYSDDEVKEIHALLASDSTVQKTFDELFAQKLQGLYREDGAGLADEKELVKKAFSEAAQAHGLFAKKPSVTLPPDSPTLGPKPGC